jgi:hypothetical protein
MSKKPQGPDTLEGLVGETMSGIAGEVAEHTAAEQREAERRARRAARERLAALILVPLALVLTVLNMAGFGWFRPGVPLPSSAAEARTAATQLLSDAVDELAFHFEENGSYPGLPDFIGPDGPGGEDEPFTYELMGSDRYELSVTVQGETVSFDSREDPDVVFREVRSGR